VLTSRLPWVQFLQGAPYNRLVPYKNRLDGYAKVKRWRANAKRKLVIGFGSRCAACGLKDHDVVFDFHHLDPSKKEIGIACQVQAWRKIVNEAAKCVMVCSHCHRKIHAGLIVLPDNHLKFDESRITVS
jgi:hypothetical protein